jgi:chemotaxis protein CheD
MSNLAQKQDILSSKAHSVSSNETYFDAALGKNVVKVFSGECYTSTDHSEVLVTILGSCIACCLYDPVQKIGGMNHFLVPGDVNSDNQSARFGINAMELLINNLMKHGARRSDLISKIFGGSNLLELKAQIGLKNIAFVKDFLKNEKIPIESEDVGGSVARKLMFFTENGKAKVKKIHTKAEDLKIAEKEKQYIDSINKIATQRTDDDVTLF